MNLQQIAETAKSAVVGLTSNSSAAEIIAAQQKKLADVASQVSATIAATVAAEQEAIRATAASALSRTEALIATGVLAGKDADLAERVVSGLKLAKSHI